MKKALLILSLSFFILRISAQDTTKQELNDPNLSKNELSIEATAFIKQFVNLYGTTGQNLSPYLFMYRRHFNEYALRVGIGGNFRNSEVKADDQFIGNSSYYTLVLKLGLEKKKDIGQRWQYYLALDLWSNIYNYMGTNDYTINANSIADRTDFFKIDNKFGIAPTLGIRFKFNDQISISTETNLQIYYFESVSLQNSAPSSPYDYNNSSKGFETSYTAPLSLYFNFRF